MTEFSNRIVGMHGETGRHWLAGLPTVVAELEELWGITAEPPRDDLAYNYIAPASLADGTEAILKLGLPRLELTNEIRWLQAQPPGQCVSLLQADQERGALLLERLTPGAQLNSLADDEAETRIAANIMTTLRQPPLEGFPTLADWSKAFDRYRAAHGQGGPLPRHLIDRASNLYMALNASAAEPVLLHGDLHHFNILSHNGAWKVIDPQGVIGEPAYEAATLLRNPNPTLMRWPDVKGRTTRRLDILTEILQVDRERIRLWGFAHTMLCACWTVEDNEPNWAFDVACAELLDAVR